MKITIGTRGSRLALIQTEDVVAKLKQITPEIEISISRIRTSGDVITGTPLAQIGSKGLFVKEIEEALLRGEIDLAVHSAKDMPTELPPGRLGPPGLIIGAITERVDPRDVLISKGNKRLFDLPAGGRIGTGSLRRKAQILASRPDLEVVDLRGNLDTRLRKLKEGEFAAIVVAAAGLIRFGQSEIISQFLPPGLMLPAAGQGALILEIREEDTESREIISKLNHLPTSLSVLAERAFLKELGGGCQVPIGALAQNSFEFRVSGFEFSPERELLLEGLVASTDGERIIRAKLEGQAEAAEEIGRSLAHQLLDSGADELLTSFGSPILFPGLHFNKS